MIEEIVAVRGLGRWTAEMFLLFHLERPDVLSGGDLGIRKAIQIEYGLEEMPTPARVIEIGERLAPPPQPRLALPLGVAGGGALVRRRFWIGELAAARRRPRRLRAGTLARHASVRGRRLRLLETCRVAKAI